MSTSPPTNDGAFSWTTPPPRKRRPVTAPGRGPNVAKKRGAIRQRADGREVEQLTIYLTPDLAQKLRIAAVTERSDMSTIVSEAVSDRLG